MVRVYGILETYEYVTYGTRTDRAVTLTAGTFW